MKKTEYSITITLRDNKSVKTTYNDKKSRDDTFDEIFNCNWNKAIVLLMGNVIFNIRNILTIEKRPGLD